MGMVFNLENKVLYGGSRGLFPPEAEAFLVFQCENMASPEYIFYLKNETGFWQGGLRSKQNCF